MSGDSGEDVKAAGLDEIAQGITLVLGELKDLGIDSLAGAGRGFSELGLSGLELGNEELLSGFTSFCERWEWGVRALVNEGNNFATGVGLSAGTLYETDQYVQGTMKIVVNAGMGNPYATEDEVTRQSWGDLVRNNEYTGGVDYSAASMDKALDNSGQAYKDAARDVMTSHTFSPLGPGLNPANLASAAGLSGDEYNDMLDGPLGPSPEERAKAAEAARAAQGQAQRGGDAG
ncbi:hypothetical protein [Streptomyces sp. NBC_00989]|uniref:hypothetical protein n=1 Tax=Streptomyces sp. NBC_00989 TaxID=2903705 RepID=UPI00386F91AC|nr:hypothetical protein OG714_19970 [Streptomyces sp. NBC_00989]